MVNSNKLDVPKIVDSRPTASFYVAGANRLNNELLATFLESETNLRCKCILDINFANMPSSLNRERILAFVDFTNFYQSDALNWLKNNSKYIPSGHLLTCFNVVPNETVELIALSNGVKGIIYNHQPINIFPKAAQSVLRDELWYPRSILEEFMDNTTITTPMYRVRTKFLTKREWEILKLLSLGFNKKEIARKSYISPHTVKAHVNNIYKKIGVHNRFEAMQWLVENRPNS